jgi:hypothetical protein
MLQEPDHEPIYEQEPTRNMAADERIRQRAEAAGLFKTTKNSVDEPQREYWLPRFGGQPGYHDFFVLRPAAFADQLDLVSKCHGAADASLVDARAKCWIKSPKRCWIDY